MDEEQEIIFRAWKHIYSAIESLMKAKKDMDIIFESHFPQIEPTEYPSILSRLEDMKKKI